MMDKAGKNIHNSFVNKAIPIVSVCILIMAGLFVLSGCRHFSEIYAPSSFTLDDLHVDTFEGKMEILNGYKGYSGRVIKISPINGAKWNDYSRSIYWEWEMEGMGIYQINVSMSILVESPDSGKPVISAYKPAQKSASSVLSSIKWNGPGNMGWTVQTNNDYYDQFGGGPIQVPQGKWVDLSFSQAVDISDSTSGQIYLDGHNDAWGLVDLTLYVRNIKVTMAPSTKFIALTFNDGPTDFTEFLLDKLNKLEVKGTFFMLGMSIDASHPIYDKSISAEEKPSKASDRRAMVKRIYDEGHEVANLSYSHSSVVKYPISEAAMRKELLDNQILIQKCIFGERDFSNYPWASKFCRITYDADSGQITNLNMAAEELNLPIISGIDNTGDNSSKNVQAIVDEIYSAIPPWGIIVNQDPRSDPTILRVLDELVPRLKNEGYLFMTLSEMAELRGNELTPGNVYYSLGPYLP